jgi:gamma-glutamyl-gamma-aminobutyrate hydrolase PuuD
MIHYYIPTGNWPLREYAYEDFMQYAGYKRTKIRGEADFLLLPGGVDFGMNQLRDDSEINDYEVFLETDRHIIGICRGMQLILKENGYDLIQHIPDITQETHHTTINGHWNGKSSWHNTKLGLLTNSRHHQGFNNIQKDWLLDETEDSIVEAFSHKKMFGVQWHPEHPEMYNTKAQDWFIWQLQQTLKK